MRIVLVNRDNHNRVDHILDLGVGEVFNESLYPSYYMAITDTKKEANYNMSYNVELNTFELIPDEIVPVFTPPIDSTDALIQQVGSLTLENGKKDILINKLANQLADLTIKVAATNGGVK